MFLVWKAFKQNFSYGFFEEKKFWKEIHKDIAYLK